MLVHLVEPCPIDGTDPLTNYRTIREELGLYSQELMQRPEVLCVTKAELPGATEFQSQLAAETNRPVFLISAVTGQGLNQLVQAIADTLKSKLHSAS